MEINLIPTEDRIIVNPIDPEEKTQSGIIIPESAREKQQEGIIVAVGEGKYLEHVGMRKKPTVQVGDRVLFGKYSGTEISTKDGHELLILKEEDVIAIVKDKSKKD